MARRREARERGSDVQSAREVPAGEVGGRQALRLSKAASCQASAERRFGFA